MLDVRYQFKDNDGAAIYKACALDHHVVPAIIAGINAGSGSTETELANYLLGAKPLVKRDLAKFLSAWLKRAKLVGGVDSIEEAIGTWVARHQTRNQQ